MNTIYSCRELFLLDKIDKQRQKILQEYLTDERKSPHMYFIPWKGKKLQAFSVYRVPTKILQYNFDNVRIRAELEGLMHQKGEKIDPDNKTHQKMVQEILLHSKWIGDMETSALERDLKSRGQIDPAVSTIDGILMDGNRRLAILRELEKQYPDKKFDEINICVLPETDEISELKELEIRMQMTHNFKVTYGNINTALEFRSLHREFKWELSEIAKITDYQYKANQIADMIQIIDLMDEYLELLPPRGKYKKQYTENDKGWQSFIELNNIVNHLFYSNTPKNIIQNYKYFGFQIIKYPRSTFSDLRRYKSTVKDKKLREKLAEQSRTLQGIGHNNLLNDDRVQEEMVHLELVKESLEDRKEDPVRIMKFVSQRLKTLKITKIDKKNQELLTLIEQIERKIKEIKKEFD